MIFLRHQKMIGNMLYKNFVFLNTDPRFCSWLGEINITALVQQSQTLYNWCDLILTKNLLKIRKCLQYIIVLFFFQEKPVTFSIKYSLSYQCRKITTFKITIVISK